MVVLWMWVNRNLMIKITATIKNDGERRWYCALRCYSQLSWWEPQWNNAILFTVNHDSYPIKIWVENMLYLRPYFSGSPKIVIKYNFFYLQVITKKVSLLMHSIFWQDYYLKWMESIQCHQELQTGLFF